MQTSVYSQLRKMESILSQIPQETKDLYKMHINHLDNDYVSLRFYANGSEFSAVSIDANHDIKVDSLHVDALNVDIIYLRFDHVSITLYPGSTPNAMIFFHKRWA